MGFHPLSAVRQRRAREYSQTTTSEAIAVGLLSPAAAAGRRFPVLYLLHGFPGQPRVFVDAGALAVDEDVMIHRHRIRPMIVVMPAGPKGYFHGDTEWADGGAGPWMQDVLEVVRNVDHRYATRRDRRQRGIGGLSEGGYGAINIALRQRLASCRPAPILLKSRVDRLRHLTLD